VENGKGLEDNMKFDRLFKKTNTGAIQFWDIEVENGFDYNECSEWEVGIIKTTYGQLGTDSPQITKDVIEEGKNVGKANETTPVEQAIAEAKAKHEKKQKSGYVLSLDGAKDDEISDLIEGGILPMLAFTFEKQGHKIKYPCYVQGKYDGIRCIAIVKNGKCTLWSRTRKPVYSCPHIIAEIEKNFKDDIILDGELYNDEFKNNFEHIVHLVRQQEPDKNCTDVQYHIYDTVNDNTFDERINLLSKKFAAPTTPNFKYLVLAETHMVEDEASVPDWFDEFKEMGLEGAILRNAAGLYVNKRSSDLIKVKEMQDDEFEIIGINEGRGKLQGHVGAFVCVTKDGKEFLAKMSGETARLREYFLNHSLWKGKQLTVQFQDLTGANNVPRFPVGLRIREVE